MNRFSDRVISFLESRAVVRTVTGCAALVIAFAVVYIGAAVAQAWVSGVIARAIQ